MSDAGDHRELHPVLPQAERRRLILEGLELFNGGSFYSCHESWETVWRSTTPEPADLLRGLIQVAVGFFHFTERHRPDVSRRVLGKASRRLEPYSPETLGLDLEDLLRQVGRWRRWLEDPEISARPPFPELRVTDPELLR